MAASLYVAGCWIIYPSSTHFRTARAQEPKRLGQGALPCPWGARTLSESTWPSCVSGSHDSLNRWRAKASAGSRRSTRSNQSPEAGYSSQVQRVSRPLSDADLDAACEIDRLCFGEKGFWKRSMYQGDIGSASTLLIGVFQPHKNGQDTLMGLGCLSHVLDEGSVTIVAVAPPFRRLGTDLIQFGHVV